MKKPINNKDMVTVGDNHAGEFRNPRPAAAELLLSLSPMGPGEGWVFRIRKERAVQSWDALMKGNNQTKATSQGWSRGNKYLTSLSSFPIIQRLFIGRNQSQARGHEPHVLSQC